MLVEGLKRTRTPLRRFLDRELSAGPRPLRESYRSQHRTPTVLLPGPGVGTEQGAVGTAIDQRVRLAFTTAAPVDLATAIGIKLAGRDPSGVGLRMRAVGCELAVRLVQTVHDLQLDDRETPIERTDEEEERLARLLIAAAWFQVLARSPMGFVQTPLACAAREDPAGFTFQRLLALPHCDMVADVVAQLHQVTSGPLPALRASTSSTDCVGGPVFPAARIHADADLLVDGLLIDIKSTRYPHHLSKLSAWQLLGYLLCDVRDQYRIDSLGLYLTRSGVLVRWPVEDYLDLLGCCRRELPVLRQAFAELLRSCNAARIPHDLGEERHVRRLLQHLAPAVAPGHCPVCTRPLPASSRRPRTYCTRWCSVRSHTLRQHGLIPY